jgi:hypothetical protein
MKARFAAKPIERRQVISAPITGSGIEEQIERRWRDLDAKNHLRELGVVFTINAVATENFHLARDTLENVIACGRLAQRRPVLRESRERPSGLPIHALSLDGFASGAARLANSPSITGRGPSPRQGPKVQQRASYSPAMG